MSRDCEQSGGTDTGAPFVGKSWPVGEVADKGARAEGRSKGTLKVCSAFALDPKGSQKGA